MKTLIILLLLSIFSFSNDFTNRLIDSQSEYLKAHAHNPVNWYPWGEEAFLKAKEENKLIFLSIGYSTCHWCHVMEKESFENEKIASILNKYYVSIKVDKEEMPHIDAKYQKALSKLTKIRNGWPLTVILTPKKEIFYIATYLPPSDKYGLKGLDTLLPWLATLYYNNQKRAKKIVEANKRLLSKKDTKKIELKNSLIEEYLQKMEKRYDNIYKGFDLRPRYPLASHLNLLFDIWLLTEDKRAKKMFFEPLTAMAKGGIYDQIEGGFFRYSSHPDWIIPHFEKMLYTQAELIPLYVKAYIFTKNPLYKKIVLETADESIKIFMQEDKLFYSATDADSEGREGGYFIYTFKEIKNALLKEGFTKKEIEEITKYLDINKIGNFEGAYSNPHINTGFEKQPKKLKKAIKILKKLREKREFPFIDKKIITSWNAMMIKAFFKASLIDEKYRNLAFSSLNNLIDKMYIKGELYHQYIKPHKISIKGFLEDYAFLIDTLIEAYENSYDKKYLNLAKQLKDKAVKKFYDPKNKTWYLDDTEIKAKSVYQDRYYTAPLSRFFHNLISIANLNYDRDELYKAKKLLEEERNNILQNIDSSPEATRALLRMKYQDVILKSSRNNLIKYQKKIHSIKYPFLLTNIQNTDNFLACTIDSCFSYSKDFEKIKKEVREKMQRR